MEIQPESLRFKAICAGSSYLYGLSDDGQVYHYTYNQSSQRNVWRLLPMGVSTDYVNKEGTSGS